MVVGFHRLLINLDRGPQTVFHEPHELDLLRETLLQRALGQPITLQLGAPSVVGSAIRMELADFGNAGSDLLEGRWLRRTNLFPQQLPINQAIEGRVALGRGERVRIAGVRKGLEGHFLLPIALQNHVAVNVGDHAVDDLTAFR